MKTLENHEVKVEVEVSNQLLLQLQLREYGLGTTRKDFVRVTKSGGAEIELEISLNFMFDFKLRKGFLASSYCTL